jgi:AcrR family transcriptional regulator
VAIIAAVAEQSKNLDPPPRGSQGLPADVVATHQRERILVATIELVAKRGYRGTSIDHIVKSARVGYAAFYELFEGKEECFCAAFDRVVEEAREQIAASVAVGAPWPEQVCAAINSLLELIAAEPFRARIVLTEAHTAGEAALRHHDGVLDQVALLLREGRTLGAGTSEPPPTLEEATVDGIVWLLNQRIVVGKVKNVDQLFPELALIVLEPYLGKAQARALIASRSGTPALA